MALAALGILASSVKAGLYDYTTSGMNGSDWQVQTYDVGYWDIFYDSVLGEDNHYFQHTDSQQRADGNRNRGAIVWRAPAGEYITQVAFNWDHNLGPAQWTQVVYRLDSGENLDGATPILWEELTYGSASGSQTLTFNSTDNLQGIGLGFDNKVVCYYGWYERFGDVTITTAPEPAGLGLLAIGALALRRRRKH